MINDTLLNKISVIVPCFNENPEVIKESFDSLIAQTYSNFECIVIDESSNYESANACEKLCARDIRFKYIRPNRRIGLAASLNLGISLSNGSFIARFDSDDKCNNRRFENQIDFLETHPDIGVVGSWMTIINSDGSIKAIRKYPADHEFIEKKFLYSNSMAHPTVLMRKSVLENEKGPYRDDFKFCEDLELWLRLIEKDVRFANLQMSLVCYRQDFTSRPAQNWDYNIKARMLHSKSKDKIKKKIIIYLIKGWSMLPKSLQEFFYKIIQFK